MLVNANIGELTAVYTQILRLMFVAISTSKLLLVPYSEHHVQRYHEWMQDKVRHS